MSLEREWQNKLDRIARVNEEFFTCKSCCEELPLEDICDHDSNVHNWCFKCCRHFYEPYKNQPLPKEYLD